MKPEDASFYVTVDEIKHPEWILDCYRRLELVRLALRRLWPEGHPTRLVQVAGTAGKGSTCRYLEAGLGLLGRAGALTSPELFDYTERFSIGGSPVPRAELVRAWEQRVRPLSVELALEGRDRVLFEHEIEILLALVLFERHEVEWAAVEAAVGGRYDQTSALDVVATALTNVGDDHREEIGEHPWQRALEKAGIARRGVPFVSGERDPELRAIIAGVCRHAGAPCRFVEPHEVEAIGARLEVPADALLAGEAQRRNAALALAVLAELAPELDRSAALEAFAAVSLPGRFWKVEEGLYADIAHNPDKVAVVAAEVERRFPDRDKIFVVGVMQTHSAAALLAPLLALARLLVLTSSTLEGQAAEAVQAELEKHGCEVPLLVVERPAQAIARAKAMRGERDVIVVTGDLDVIDEGLNPDPYLRYLNAHAGWRSGG